MGVQIVGGVVARWFAFTFLPVVDISKVRIANTIGRTPVLEVAARIDGYVRRGFQSVTEKRGRVGGEGDGMNVTNIMIKNLA